MESVVLSMNIADTPDNVKRLMSPADKKAFGVAALTINELIERQEVNSEKDFQNQVADYLRMKGIPFYRSRMDKRTRNKVGQPDFLICLPPHGRFIGLECKVPGQLATEDQLNEIEAILKAGGFAIVVRSLAEVKTILEYHSILEHSITHGA